MRSLLVEFHRFNDLDSGSWRKGDPYLVAAASHRVREFRMPLGQDEFLDLMLDLRYQGAADARVTALKKVGAVATDFLGNECLNELGNGARGLLPIQLDLVVNPAELSALPFEAATDAEGRPLFARREPLVVLTRRVRHDFAETRLRWPARPRILYGWASPPGVARVPSQEHEQALRAALEPWIPLQEGAEPDASNVLTTLPEMSLEALEAACRDAVDGKARAAPYTHVHLLAHGYPIGRGHRQRFGMALHSENGDLDEVTPEQIEEALAPLIGHAVVVTMATCDAANLANTTTSQRSIAHNLHVSGFPIVLASQLPFTVAGSNLLVENFYQALLRGKDVRVALHETRVALYENQQVTGHDWTSLVGYAQLPEGYAEHLLDVRLESMLASLRTMQSWSDKLVMQGSQDAARLDHVELQLRHRIEALESFLEGTEQIGRRGVREENLGLLGSAEKRLAELCFVRSRVSGADQWLRGMREALQRSRDWYRKGYEHNLSHHWTAVQYLSLEGVLEGRIANPGLWQAAVVAAAIDCGSPNAKDAIWARGSLVELYLLARLAGQEPAIDAASKAVAEMKVQVREMNAGDLFPLESTERQLRRYVDWWTHARGFFPGASDLAAEAASLLAELRR